MGQSRGRIFRESSTGVDDSIVGLCDLCGEVLMSRMAGEADDEDEDDEHPRDRRAVERRRKRQEERASKVNSIRSDIIKSAGGPLTGEL